MKFEFFGIAANNLLIGKTLFTVLGYKTTLCRFDHVDNWKTSHLKQRMIVAWGKDRGQFAITSYKDRYIYVTGGTVSSALTRTVLEFDIQLGTVTDDFASLIYPR